MGLDLLIRGGTVVDGTGSPRRRADVGVVNGRIAVVDDQVRETAAETIDAGGLAVAPGFIDSHTHLESQFFWDQAAGPASWHGCTTVIMGNCGLSLAPLNSGDRGFAGGLMSSVEQIPKSILTEVVPFDWDSFGGFVASLERHGIGVNAASFVGYSLVRHAAMGERAFGGSATEDDLLAMRRLLDEALGAGALGISFNRAKFDHDEHGRLMPGWDAEWQEIARMAATIEGHPGAMLQAIPSWADLSEGWGEVNEVELEAWTKILVGLGRPMVWSAVSEADSEAQLRATRMARAAGASLTAAIHAMPMNTFGTFSAPSLFASTPALGFLFDLPEKERLQALQNDAVRASIRSSMGHETFVAYPLRHVSETGEVAMGHDRTFRWDQIYRLGAPPERFQLGRSVVEEARSLGVHPVDVVLDAALTSGLREVFAIFVFGNRPEVTSKLLLDPATVIASNDTGAHLLLMAQSQSTHLIAHWCRTTQTLSLEQAVHLLSGRQASVFGIPDRGVLAAGKAADIVVFDPDKIGPQAPEIVDDLPGRRGQRYITRGLGINRVIVNGTTLLIDGEPTGATPGRFLGPHRCAPTKHI